MSDPEQLSVEEYEDILYEVWELARVESLNAALGQTIPEAQALWALDKKLQEILQGIHTYRAGALSGWLRYTSRWQHLLPTWQPLLNATYAIMLQRLPREQVEKDLLWGLLPR